MTDDHLTDWRERCASDWADTIPTVLATAFPYGAAHQALAPDDVDVTPDLLHPAFHGCLDWHSSVHMQWSAVRLLTLAPGQLSLLRRDRLRAVLDARLTREHLEREAAYLRDRPGFERPYGWGWAAALALAAKESSAPGADAWAAATRPLFDTVADLALTWLPRLAYPVRHGTHANTAFALALVHEAASRLGRPDVVDAIAERARDWFGQDTDYPVAWEPSGSDFLSPALCEADLMGRVLTTQQYAGWLAAFLPGLGAADDPLLELPEVRDRSDGHAVHLFGLALSRAWQLRRVRGLLSPDRSRRVAEATAQQVAHVEREIVAGDFMSTHWLVSFAVLAATSGPGAARQ
ncbi:DUF2891 family protein [Allobranchiibius sp. CTAmp26]|uniref:DUF2891 family protein n=1 Tax=Allobranchiibius sp. CTAmp26 TaxID=2815214 RepID=UPI001AA0C769|nr:DUF2891 family protein [Allobranchiibius sp. CTAmp26]MBO1753892.1 DUF2891 family protein [Allobranchiibius sp. CTAmp26]